MKVRYIFLMLLITPVLFFFSKQNSAYGNAARPSYAIDSLIPQDTGKKGGLPEYIKSIHILDQKAEVVLKNGSAEHYNLSVETEKNEFLRKYRKLVTTLSHTSDSLMKTPASPSLTHGAASPEMPWIIVNGKEMEFFPGQQTDPSVTERIELTKELSDSGADKKEQIISRRTLTYNKGRDSIKASKDSLVSLDLILEKKEEPITINKQTDISEIHHLVDAIVIINGVQSTLDAVKKLDKDKIISINMIRHQGMAGSRQQPVVIVTTR